MRKTRNPAHTRVYHRDLERTHQSAFQTHDDKQLDDQLHQTEKERFKAPKWANEGGYQGARFYALGRELLKEYGGDTSGLFQGKADDFNSTYGEYAGLPRDQRRTQMQRLLTRMKATLDPHDKSKNGGGGKGKKGKGEDEQQQQQGQQQKEREEEEEQEYQPQPRSSSGGGRQFHAEVEDQSLFYAVRYLIAKLAEHDDYSATTPFGHERWDVKRVLQSHWDPLVLDEAKRDYAREVDDIYLILDTSGSVSYLATNIAAIAAGAVGIVHLYSGTEARPQLMVPRTTPLRTPTDNFPEWADQQSLTEGREDEYNAFVKRTVEDYKPLYPEWRNAENSFEMDLAWWLHVVKPKKRSRILFWGDTQGVGFYCPRLDVALLHPYRAAWLLSEPFKESWDAKKMEDYYGDIHELALKHPQDLGSPEWPKWQTMGLPVIENVQTAEHVRGMLQTLQMLDQQEART